MSTNRRNLKRRDNSCGCTGGKKSFDNLWMSGGVMTAGATLMGAPIGEVLRRAQDERDWVGLETEGSHNTATTAAEAGRAPYSWSIAVLGAAGGRDGLPANHSATPAAAYTRT